MLHRHESDDCWERSHPLAYAVVRGPSSRLHRDSLGGEALDDVWNDQAAELLLGRSQNAVQADDGYFAGIKRQKEEESSPHRSSGDDNSLWIHQGVWLVVGVPHTHFHSHSPVEEELEGVQAELQVQRPRDCAVSALHVQSWRHSNLTRPPNNAICLDSPRNLP